MSSRLVDDRAKRVLVVRYAPLCVMLIHLHLHALSFSFFLKRERARTNVAAHARPSATKRLRRSYELEEGETGHAKRRSHIRMGHWRQHCTVSNHGLRLFTVPYLISLPGTLLGAKYLARKPTCDSTRACTNCWRSRSFVLSSSFFSPLHLLLYLSLSIFLPFHDIK